MGWWTTPRHGKTADHSSYCQQVDTSPRSKNPRTSRGNSLWSQPRSLQRPTQGAEGGDPQNPLPTAIVLSLRLRSLPVWVTPTDWRSWSPTIKADLVGLGCYGDGLCIRNAASDRRAAVSMDSCPSLIFINTQNWVDTLRRFLRLVNSMVSRNRHTTRMPWRLGVSNEK